ncbi:MAG TPA: hypothetical protein EYH32_00580 [Anaerolineae bacterium]|nr:hypothetical protein [Anaerolineae bacterium]
MHSDIQLHAAVRPFLVTLTPLLLVVLSVACQRTDTRVPTPVFIPAPVISQAPAAPQNPQSTIRNPKLEEAYVLRVVDGDTIEVEIGGQRYKVRYTGVDTPETKHPAKPIECFGHEATEKNRELVEGKTVYLEKDVSETDRYGRLLRYVHLADGTFVNAELVRLGYAQVATYPPDVKYVDLFLRLQHEARQAGRGLWSQCQP